MKASARSDLVRLSMDCVLVLCTVPSILYREPIITDPLRHASGGEAGSPFFAPVSIVRR
jgi:hypothetical protein